MENNHESVVIIMIRTILDQNHLSRISKGIYDCALKEKIIQRNDLLLLSLFKLEATICRNLIYQKRSYRILWKLWTLWQAFLEQQSKERINHEFVAWSKTVTYGTLFNLQYNNNLFMNELEVLNELDPVYWYNNKYFYPR